MTSTISNKSFFDFKAYLNAIDPRPHYDIQRLVGGCVNFTVRATKTSKSKEGRFPSHKSLVLKYAPPFVAYLGEEAPFSQHRQTIEAQALGLFNPEGILNELNHNSSLRVPALLHYDPEAHVLVMSDLGQSRNLSDIFRSLSDEVANDSRDAIIVEYTQMGSHLGLFFANLHSRSSRDLIGTENMVAFDSIDNKELIYKTLIEPLTSYLNTADMSDGTELYERAKVDFLETVHPEEECFCFGDAWTGAILKIEGSSFTTTNGLGIVDWEFAGRGRVLSDMGQLLADLHAYLIMAPVSSMLRLAVETLMKSICSSYRQRLREHAASWALPPETGSDSAALRSSELSDVTLRTLRSVYILHGREMVAYAFRRSWECSCCEGLQRDGCSLRQEMVLKGAWYLRRAGRNVAEFAESENWSKICSEKDWILGGLLFGP